MDMYLKAKNVSGAIKSKARSAFYQLYETRAVIRKQSLYQSVSWDKKQQKDFDIYWQSLLGKKISNRWHKLYQSYNGVFCKEYIPEMLYTAYIEPRLNNRDYSVAFGNKAITELLFHDASCEFPETLASSDGHYFYNGERSVINQGRFDEIIADAGRIVVKPAASYGSGQGILFLDMHNGVNIDTGEDISTIKKKLISPEVVVQRYVEQHDDLATICPTSVNTIRISTYIVNDEVHYSPIVMRCGNGRSKLDNIHAGGYCVAVDEDGSVGEIAYKLGYADICEKMTTHPVTNKQFSKCRITEIASVIDAACRLHGRLPHIGVIGWDFSISKAGKPLIIEANYHGNGIWLPQIVHGKCFFRNDTKEILASVGLLKC